MLQLIEYSAADDAVVAVVAELLEAAAVEGERLEAVAAVGSTAGHVSVAVAVGIHKTDNPVLLHCPSAQKSSHPLCWPGSHCCAALVSSQARQNKTLHNPGSVLHT